MSFPPKKYKVALFIRGHIRDGLFSPDLKRYVESLAKKREVELSVYCQSWKYAEADSSYRHVDNSARLVVTPNLIQHYFGEVKGLIKDISILDDKKIKMHQTTDGLICASKIPKIAWKNMWAGIYHGLQTIPDDFYRVINTRWDYFTRPICQANVAICNSIVFNHDFSFRYPSRAREVIGVDNFYCGALEPMKRIAQNFHENLDDIISKYPNVKFQEELVYLYARDNGICK
jgi:hypothetical protein